MTIQGLTPLLFFYIKKYVFCNLTMLSQISNWFLVFVLLQNIIDILAMTEQSNCIVFAFTRCITGILNLFAFSISFRDNEVENVSDWKFYRISVEICLLEGINNIVLKDNYLIKLELIIVILITMNHDIIYFRWND